MFQFWCVQKTVQTLQIHLVDLPPEFFTPEMPTTPIKENSLSKMSSAADYFGMMASTLCLFHCLGIPLLLSVFPLLGIPRQEEVFHQYMMVIVTMPALFALIPGFIAHRRTQVLILGVVGLFLFIASVMWIGPRYGQTAETLFSVIGSTHLLAAHFKNRTFCRSCIASRQKNRCVTPIC
jgi:apolipoprotein N-acyltransferase